VGLPKSGIGKISRDRRLLEHFNELQAQNLSTIVGQFFSHARFNGAVGDDAYSP
jgi:hypothetical protein